LVRYRQRGAGFPVRRRAPVAGLADEILPPVSGIILGFSVIVGANPLFFSTPWRSGFFTF